MLKKLNSKTKSFTGAAMVFMAAFLFALFSASVFSPSDAADATRVVTYNDAAGYTLTFTSSDDVSLTTIATPSGTLDIASDNLSVETNSPNGYKLYLSMNTDSEAKLYKDGDPTSPSFFAPTSGTFGSPAPLTANTWGYAFAKDSSNNFSTSYDTEVPDKNSTFAAVPERTHPQLIMSSSSATTDNKTIYYGANANTALPSGFYQNIITYTAVSGGGTLTSATISPSVVYNLAGGDTVTIATSLNAPAASVGSAEVLIGGKACGNPIVSNSASGTVNVSCTTPSNSSGVYDVVVNFPTYSQTFALASALEYKEQYQTLEDIKYMQDITPEICTNTAVHASATLTDLRDGNTYEVRKLKDGNCWMTNNLRLDLNVNQALTNDTTDLNSKTSWLPDNNTQETDGIDWGRYDLQSSIDTTRSYHNDEYGNLYNYYAATAASGNYSTTSGNSLDSICPRGWGLPENNDTDTSWGRLLNVYSLEENSIEAVNSIQDYPISLLLGGYYLQDADTSTTDPGTIAIQGYVYKQGRHGHFWSRSVFNDKFVYYLHVNTDTDNIRLIARGYHRKAGGRSIRCVSPGKTLSSITTMQDLTPQICASTPTPVAVKGDGTINADVPEAILTDTRDGNTYRVRKLADGNCWMTENLRLTFADVNGDGIVGVKSADGTRETAMDSTNTDLNSRSSWTPTVATQTTSGAPWGSNGSAGTTGSTNDQYAAVEHSYWDNLTLQDGDGNTQPRGSYYNWYTATAMSGTFAMGSSGATNAPDSICPKGWQLPTNSGDKSFQNLIVAKYQLLTTPGYGNSSARDALMKNPFSYVYSGYYEWINGNIYSGSNAYFWSSEAYASTYAHYLDFNSNGYVNPQDGYNKPYGFSVRCVLK